METMTRPMFKTNGHVDAYAKAGGLMRDCRIASQRYSARRAEWVYSLVWNGERVGEVPEHKIKGISIQY